MNRRKIVRVSEVIEEINRFNAVDIISLFTEVRFISNSYQTLCPVHNDTKLGSFFIKDKYFKCFACGATGTAVDFVKIKYNTTFTTAVDIIAKKLNIIPEDYKVWADRRDGYRQRSNRNIIRKVKVKKKVKRREYEEVGNPEELNYMYNIFLNQLKLDREDLRHLLLERRLTRQDILETKYRSLNGELVIDEVISKLKEEGKTEKEIINLFKKTPGFYYDKVDNRWKHVVRKSIIIPIRDINRNIVALQMRVKHKTPNKYRWFSSSFAFKGNKDKFFGNKPDNTIDFITKDNKKLTNIEELFITEGNFKAKAILNTTNKKNTACISIQGVNNRHGLTKLIKSIKNFNRINIMLDADFQINKAVKQQLIKMTKEIETITDKPVVIWTWEYTNNTKGIDDLIFNKDIFTPELMGKYLYKYNIKENKKNPHL